MGTKRESVWAERGIVGRIEPMGPDVPASSVPPSPPFPLFPAFIATKKPASSPFRWSRRLCFNCRAVCERMITKGGAP